MKSNDLKSMFSSTYNNKINVPLSDYKKDSNLQQISKFQIFIKPKLDIKILTQSINSNKRKITVQRLSLALPKLNHSLSKKVNQHIKYVKAINQEKNIQGINPVKLTFKDLISSESLERIKSSHVKANSRNEFSGNNKEGRGLKENKLSEELGKEISLDKVNIITYINSKENISENLLKKLCNCDENHLVKADKACKKALIKEEEDKKFKRYLEEKHNQKQNFRFNDYKRSLDEMGLNLKKAQSIQIDYVPAVKNKESFYSEKLLELKNKFWNGKVERLNEKSRRIKIIKEKKN
jgi:hypothetical protein